ncbi:unnamed protein product [Cuscuta campestris]|uniref:Uncharacterized protein n=1 Tax=Cuscuta campestris TaxID=132261 RepID=A0A484MJE3_9ASTE|nr:unnamed protein product [Cuscuta campestris]
MVYTQIRSAVVRLEGGQIPRRQPRLVPDDSLVHLPGGLSGDHEPVIHPGDDLFLAFDHAFELQGGVRRLVDGGYGESSDLHHLGGRGHRDGPPSA